MPRSTGLKISHVSYPEKYKFVLDLFSNVSNTKGKKIPLSKPRAAVVLKSQLGDLLTTNSADAGMLMTEFCMPAVPSLASLCPFCYCELAEDINWEGFFTSTFQSARYSSLSNLC